MSEPRPDAVPNTEAGPPATGSVLTLREAREQAGVRVEALAASLKVPVRLLEALEAGRYDELPDRTFARTLALSVCRQLKLDPAPVLAHMPTAAQVRLGESETALHTPMPKAGGSVLTRAVAAPVQTLSTPAALAMLVLAVALALWFLLPQQDVPEPLAAPEAPPAQINAPAPADAPAPDAVLAPTPQTPPAAAAPRQPEPAAPTPTPSAPPLGAAAPAVAAPAVPASVPAALPPAPAPAPAPATPVPLAVPAAATADPAAPLRLSAQQSAWVQVTGASGRVLLQRHLQAGEEVGFAHDLPLQVVIGRADAVQVAVRGQALDLAAHSRNNVARLQVR